MSTAPNVKVVRDGFVAVVTVDRQPKYNALNRAVIDELAVTFRELDADDSVGAIVLTGAGEKAFVAGADIAELATMNNAEGVETSQRGQSMMQSIADSKKPVIAAINGFALGGGLELALACDMRFASTNAKLGLPEVSLGIIPGYAATQRLPRLCGTGMALQLILTGDPIGAEEARRIGLVNGVCEQQGLLDHCKAIARSIVSRGAQAVAMAKQVVYRGADVTLAEGQAIEARMFGQLSGTEEMKEGMTAFLEKRAPAWKRG